MNESVNATAATPWGKIALGVIIVVCILCCCSMFMSGPAPSPVPVKAPSPTPTDKGVPADKGAPPKPAVPQSQTGATLDLEAKKKQEAAMAGPKLTDQQLAETRRAAGK